MMEKIKGYPDAGKGCEGFGLQALGILGVGCDDLDDLGIKKKEEYKRRDLILTSLKKDCYYCCYCLLEFLRFEV